MTHTTTNRYPGCLQKHTTHSFQKPHHTTHHQHHTPRAHTPTHDVTAPQSDAPTQRPGWSPKHTTHAHGRRGRHQRRTPTTPHIAAPTPGFLFFESRSPISDAATTTTHRCMLAAMLASLRRAISGQPQYRTDQVLPLMELAEMAWDMYQTTGKPGHGALLRVVLRDFWDVVSAWERDDEEEVSLGDLLSAA